MGNHHDETPAVSITVENVHPTRRVATRPIGETLRYVALQEELRIRSLSLILGDHDRVLELNRTFLNHDFHTDVLTFSLSDGEEIEGEIYVDLDTAAERFSEFDTTFENEVARYAIHGLLHLAGYTDKDAADCREMKHKEERYLRETETLRH